jgi:uncharacterized protein
MKGAGGTPGGSGIFILGILMMCGGFYLLLSSISVASNFGMGLHMYGFSAFGQSYGITSGMVMIPFIFGVGMLFYNANSVLAWVLTLGSMTALIFGVISSIHFGFRNMSAFELIVILVLAFGGLGLFLQSLKSQ